MLYPLLDQGMAPQIKGMHYAGAMNQVALCKLFEAEIQIAVAPNPLSAEAARYVASIDLGALVEAKRARSPSPEKPFLFAALCEAQYEIAFRDTERAASAILPEREGRDDFIAHLAATAITFTALTGARRCSVVLRILDVGSYGIFHRDNRTDFRGIQTFRGQGTLGALPEVWDGYAPSINHYGIPQITALSLAANGVFKKGAELVNAIEKSGHKPPIPLVDDEKIYELPNTAFAVWKGDGHPLPWIHSEPAVATPAERRLSAIFNMVP